MATKGNKASLQTFHALQASDLAAAMNEAMKKVRISPGDYWPELTAPEGPSTGGGVQAMQHLRLVSGQAGQAAIVVGHANHAAGKAELRTYEHVEAMFRQRFQRDLALDRRQYEDFLGFAKQLFDALRLQTTIVGPPQPSAPPTSLPPARPAFSRLKWSVAGVAVLLAAAAGFWLAFHPG